MIMSKMSQLALKITTKFVYNSCVLKCVDSMSRMFEIFGGFIY